MHISLFFVVNILFNDIIRKACTVKFYLYASTFLYIIIISKRSRCMYSFGLNNWSSYMTKLYQKISRIDANSRTKLVMLPIKIDYSVCVRTIIHVPSYIMCMRRACLYMRVCIPCFLYTGMIYWIDIFCRWLIVVKLSLQLNFY